MWSNPDFQLIVHTRTTFKYPWKKLRGSSDRSVSGALAFLCGDTLLSWTGVFAFFAHVLGIKKDFRGSACWALQTFPLVLGVLSCEKLVALWPVTLAS